MGRTPVDADEGGAPNGDCERTPEPALEASIEERALAIVDESEDCEEPPISQPHAAPGGMPAGVTAVKRDARRLVTIPATHGVWSKTERHGISAKGMLVRLYPPASAEDSRIEEVAQLFRSSGAEGVKVMPRLPGPTVRASNAEELVVGPPRPMREVVMGFVERVTAEQRPAVEALLSEAMDVGEIEAAREGVLVPLPGAPLYVTELRLMNWLRYEGIHLIELEPTIYGVTAKQEGDPERSNWMGKSSVLEAIAFAITGWHRWPTEDAWITRGTKEGGVLLVLSDGTRIERHRKKSTQLTVGTPDGRTLNGEHAQAEIDRRIGLTEDDFFATCFFRQKELAKLIKAKPAERLEIVRGWLALAPVVHAEEWVRGQIGTIAVKLERATFEARRLAEALEVGKGTFPGAYVAPEGVDWDGWIRAEQRAEQEAESQARALEAEAAAVKEGNAGLARWEQDAAAAARRPRLRGEHDRERGQLAVMVKDLEGLKEVRAARAKERLACPDIEPLKVRLPLLQTAANEAAMKKREAERETAQKKQLAAGEFDGVCPVAGIECPATAAINAPRAKNRKLYEAAQGVQAAALKAWHGAEAEQNEVLRALDRVDLLDEQIARQDGEIARQVSRIDAQEARIAAIEAEHAALASAEERIERDGQPQRRPEIDTRPAWQAVSSARARVQGAEQAKASNERLTQEQAAACSERAKLEQEIAEHRQAIAILGKGGAQKAIAASELQAIEQATNAMLAGAGVDLSIAIRWGNPSTTTLQASCDGCGYVYTSAKLKSCPRCEVVRGPKLDDKLEVELSDRSGAAEDLAGIALQLAASAWLRARRGAAWAMVAIDEPFGALDAANGRALAVHLAGMLHRGAFRQGFVIAHTPAAMDALPSRLQVTGAAGRDGRSTIEVMR